MKTTAVVAFWFGSAVAAFATEPAVANQGGYVPCKVHQTALGVFPVRLLHQGVINGEATALLEIDGKGQIADQLIVSYTHREFADELIRTVKRWKFDPGVIDHQPVISVVTVTFEYTVNGVLAYERQVTDTHDSPMRDRLAYRPYGTGSLDHNPGPLAKPAPVYPEAWANDGHTGHVVVTFFIDEAGHARLPTVNDPADDLLASVAIAAVKQWRFEPPLRAGKPVLVQAEQEFVFERKSANAAGKS